MGLMAIIRLSVISALALTAASAQQTSNGSEQLQSAVSKGHRLGAEDRGVTAVEELLDRGLDVNAQDSVGWTALMMASLEGLPKVVRTLLQRGADANVRSQKGETALIIAAGCFIVRTKADLAQERGFGPEMKVQQLNSPLLIVRELARHGADINAATKDGRTALMSAAMHGWRDIVQELIAAGAKPNATDTRGRNAIDYADPADSVLLAILRAAGPSKGSGRSGRTVCDAQAALNRLGLRSGRPDCWWGKSTADALREFQRRSGIRSSGELDGSTMRSLRIRH